MSNKAEQIKNLPVGSVITFKSPDEGTIAFLKGIVFSGDDPQTAEEHTVWVAPNLLTFEEEAFSGEDAPLDDLEIVFTAEPVL